MRRVVLHIERLVLRGINRADATAVAAALDTELRSLFGTPDATRVLTGRTDVDRLSTGPLRVPPGGGAAVLGSAVANRIVRGMKP